MNLQSLLLSTIFSLLLSFIMGKHTIRYLRAFQYKGQPIREDGPKSHITSKKGTPTMGGLIILITILLSAFICLDMTITSNQVMLFVFCSNGLLGAIDDLMKLNKHSSKGLRAKMKLIIQISIAVITILWLKLNCDLYSTIVKIPATSYELDLGWGYLIFGAFIIVASGNSVNLTDGLDGLVIIPVISVVLVLSFLNPAVSGFSSILIGSCLGFLWHNAYPAKVFMGDIGSLAIGALVGSMAVISKQEIVFAIASTIFIVESVSVILQVYYFKFTGGKRIFPMAPIHHSFEAIGMHEVTIVVRFWIASIFFALVALLISQL